MKNFTGIHVKEFGPNRGGWYLIEERYEQDRTLADFEAENQDVVDETGEDITTSTVGDFTVYTFVDPTTAHQSSMYQVRYLVDEPTEMFANQIF